MYNGWLRSRDPIMTRNMIPESENSVQHLAPVVHEWKLKNCDNTASDETTTAHLTCQITHDRAVNFVNEPVRT
jgi:hypothetical protein